MANTIFSRIINTHDTEANWNKTDQFIPRSGELIIYDRDAYHNYSRFKIGNGFTDVKELPFVNDTIEQLLLTKLFGTTDDVIHLQGGCITSYQQEVDLPVTEEEEGNG